MPVEPDEPRHYIGASVEVKAMFVTFLAERNCRFGTIAPPGRVRAITFIVADFYVDNNAVKRGKLNIRGVKAVECSELHNELNESLRQHENPIDIMSPAPADPPVAANSPAQPQPQPSPPPAAAATVSASAPTSVAVRTPTATTTPVSAEAAVAGTTNDEGGGSPTALTFQRVSGSKQFSLSWNRISMGQKLLLWHFVGVRL